MADEFSFHEGDMVVPDSQRGENRNNPDPRLHGKDPAASPGRSGSYPLLCHLLDTAVVIEHLWFTRVREGLRVKIAEALGGSVGEVSVGEAGRVLVLVAAIHDVGKLNPFFQYQERSSASSAFADELAAAVGLPRTPALLRQELNAVSKHPLRRHEFITHRAVTGNWPTSDAQIRDDHWVGVLAGGHHGYWRSPSVNGSIVTGEGDRMIEGWTSQQQAIVDRVTGVIGLSLADVPPLSSTSPMVPFFCFSGLLTLADWIASDDFRVAEGKAMWEDRFRTDLDPYASDGAARQWMQDRGERLLKHVEDSLGRLPGASREDLDAAILGSYTPRTLQAEAKRMGQPSDPGLWICMYPTGDGKTEAALLRGAVDPTEGTFFGLPTLATTDAMEARLSSYSQGLADPNDFRFIKSHQFADFTKPGHEPHTSPHADDDECCDQANPSWYTAPIRKLVAPNVVGTVDQVLVGALAQRHITLRLFGLANHHVILDEVHTYDQYQTELLIELLYWWGATGTRVTLLSATLPVEHMKAMVRSYRAGVLGSKYKTDAPSVESLEACFPSTVSVGRTVVDGDIEVVQAAPAGPVRRPQDTRIDLVEVVSRADRVKSHVLWARDIAATHKASPIAIVSNVVADCVEIATALAEDPSVSATHDVICLHSGLVAEHRMAAEECLTDRAGRSAHEAGFGKMRRPVLVVGTQVIQASLDFDVDFMATDLAPAPDLIQRLGRAWRFEGALDGPLRGGRLSPSSDRALRVLSVVGEDRLPTREGSLPYLVMVLRRTHEALRSRVESDGGLVDIFGFSQEWVDIAYDRDPAGLISEDEDEQKHTVAEVLDSSRKTNSAELARAPLAREAQGTVALLPAPRRIGPKVTGTVWSDLVALTHRADDEDLMRTRYIERESMTVILFDSTGESSFVDPKTGRSVRFEVLTVGEIASLTTSESIRLFERFRCVVPSALRLVAEGAISATLKGQAWEPQSKILRSTQPLDLKHLAIAATYHPKTGLMKKDCE